MKMIDPKRYPRTNSAIAHGHVRVMNGYFEILTADDVWDTVADCAHDTEAFLKANPDRAGW